MLDQATHILLLTASDSEAVTVYGPPLDRAELAELADLRQPKPMARRHRAGAVLSVPVDAGRWCLWLVPSVPKVSDLAPLLARAQAISAGFCQDRLRPASAKPIPAHETGIAESIARIGERLQRRTKDMAAFVSLLGEHLVEMGAGKAVAVFRPDTRKIWISDERLAPQKHVLRSYLAEHAKTEGPGRLIRADGDSETELEARLILSAVGYESFWITPTEGKPRYLAVLFDPALPLKAIVPALPALLQIAAPVAPPIDPSKARRKKMIGWGAAAAAALFLLWPVPQKITVTGTAMPAEMNVVSLPGEAVLVDMLTRVGDTVTAGQVIARFRSQALQEQQAQETLNMTVEELNAQAAMAKNDYGAYQISAQRYEIAKARLAQVDQRIAQLEVKAAVSGRVVSALAQNETGASHPVGTPVVSVQQGGEFVVRLNPSKVDARRITKGMEGRIFFRGLAGTEFGVRVLTPAAVVTAADGTEALELIAAVDGEGTEQLLSGLAGYARLEGSYAPRIWGMAHYLIEYLRVKAWTFLGLHL